MFSILSAKNVVVATVSHQPNMDDELAQGRKVVETAEPVGIGWSYQDGLFVAPQSELPSYAELRQAAILEKWPMAAQLEALTEAAEVPARPEKMNQLLADIQEIKAQFPKPDTL
ncbi:hypothetical protein [Halodesulfovibrio aestuarii]|uniref:Phage tail protein n=1 Tax=Halodesulfovibrio aestuarii TaxID=126333 RepID=A0ABV4JPV6_9BACT